MTDLFFNTEIINHSSSELEFIANFCFCPIRYLFQGRTIEILDEKVEKEYLSFTGSDWKKTALAILALIPGLLIGIPAKLFSYCFASARENYHIVSQHDQQLSSPAEEEIEEEIPFELLNLDLIYNSAPEGFSYSLPRKILESYFSGVAFDNKKEYTSEERQGLKADIQAIYQDILIEKPVKKTWAIMTAGAPGSGKTILMKQHRNAQEEVIAYICPDDVCLQSMERTFKQEMKEKMDNASLTEEEHKMLRLEIYNKWRPGSNAAAHVILANLIRQQYAFYFGTTSSGPATGKFLEFLKSKGYIIKLLHITAPDDVRWASIQERDKTFIQTTEQDVREKGYLVPQRIMDAYTKFADEIEFYYRDAVKEDAVLAARWTHYQQEIPGELTIVDQMRYDKIKHIHNVICDILKKPELYWEKWIEKDSSEL